MLAISCRCRLEELQHCLDCRLACRLPLPLPLLRHHGQILECELIYQSPRPQCQMCHRDRLVGSNQRPRPVSKIVLKRPAWQTESLVSRTAWAFGLFGIPTASTGTELLECQ